MIAVPSAHTSTITEQQMHKLYTTEVCIGLPLLAASSHNLVAQPGARQEGSQDQGSQTAWRIAPGPAHTWEKHSMALPPVCLAQLTNT